MTSRQTVGLIVGIAWILVVLALTYFVTHEISTLAMAGFAAVLMIPFRR